MSSSTEIISAFSIPEFPRVFTLGSFAARVTFHSQQCRAFNLVWALIEEGILGKRSNLAVVGGGLGGITAAAAAALKGCSVTLFERSGQLMPLQRGNHTRLIHPHVYTWPANGWSSNSTKLPVLNWHAGTPDLVVRQIEKEWRLIESQVTLRLGTEVQRLMDHYKGLPVLSSTPGFAQLAFDAVILATGFGREKVLAGTELRSYWENDDLHQAVVDGRIPRRFLVTGCGDGGLIDALRLCLLDFNEQEFAERVLGGDSLLQMRLALLDIERRLQGISSNEANFFLAEQYQRIPIPDSVLGLLMSRLRSDTEVTLNGTAPNPLSYHASIMHRFIVFLLLTLCSSSGRRNLGYLNGRVQEPVSRHPFGWEVTVIRPGVTMPEISHYDEIIVRHGPAPIVATLLPDGIAQHLPRAGSIKADPTEQPAWPSDFFMVLSRDGQRPRSGDAQSLEAWPRHPSTNLRHALDKTLAGLVKRRGNGDNGTLPNYSEDTEES